MKATEIIESILKLGTVLLDAFSRTSHYPIDVTTFLYSEEFRAIAPDLRALARTLQQSDFDAGIREVDAKQQAFLRGRGILQLPAEELIQYSKLAEVRLLFATQRLKDALEERAIDWLLHDALPRLAPIATTVIPLLRLAPVSAR